MKIFRCVTVSRSGSYAMFHWLMYQFSSQKKNRLITNNYIHITGCADIVFERYADTTIPLETRKTFKKGRGDWQPIPNLKERKCVYVIMLRDPFNLFASQCNQRYLKRQSKTKIEEIKDAWKGHAREFLRETNYFSNKVGINYNKWFLDKDYRKKISEQIGGNHSDRKIHIMPRHGGGSSFVKMDKRFIRNAQKLSVLNRWKYFLDKTQNNKEKVKFMSVFKDRELIELSKKIFGNIKGTEKLYK